MAPYIPPGAATVTVHHAQGRFVAQGDVSSISDTHKASMQAAIASELVTSENLVRITVQPASVLIQFEVEYPTLSEAESARDHLSTRMTTPSQASDFFSAA